MQGRWAASNDAKASERHVRLRLRHTFASLYLAQGSNLLWVQRQGGWTSPKVLLDTCIHFMPSELSADEIAAATDGRMRP